MVVSVETTLMHPGRGFIKLEDTVVVTDAGWLFGDTGAAGIAREPSDSRLLTWSTWRIVRETCRFRTPASPISVVHDSAPSLALASS